MGLWIMGAFWSLPFQLIISPVRWASEAASEIADRAAVDMESQAHMDEEKRGMSGYPSPILYHEGRPQPLPALGATPEHRGQRLCLKMFKMKLQNVYLLVLQSLILCCFDGGVYRRELILAIFFFPSQKNNIV